MVVITIVRWGYKPTYNYGASHCRNDEVADLHLVPWSFRTDYWWTATGEGTYSELTSPIIFLVNSHCCCCCCCCSIHWFSWGFSNGLTAVKETAFIRAMLKSCFISIYTYIYIHIIYVYVRIYIYIHININNIHTHSGGWSYHHELGFVYPFWGLPYDIMGLAALAGDSRLLCLSPITWSHHSEVGLMT